MTHIRQWIHIKHIQWDITAENFLYEHPYWSMLGTCTCMPVCILLAVFGTTYAVMAPIAWLCGWL